jgi:flagellar hook assembly protein FlgD
VVTLQDGYGQRTVDNSIIITIDNTPPATPDITIDGDKGISNSQSVMISLVVEDAPEMLIEGDIAESADAFQWIPFTDTKEVELSEGDGAKNILVKVRDSAGNISEPASASIILDRSIPSKASISVNDGAEYTESHQITLSLSAESGREMFISGDVVQDERNFRWLPFQSSYSTRLTEGEGEKTVFALFRNGVGNEGDEVDDQITLDFSPPAITSIRAFDALDETDDDLNFHAGQPIILEAIGDETGLEAWVLIRAEDDSTQSYDSGRQSMTDMGNGSYMFLWNTGDIADGNYLCEFTLEDIARHSVTDTLEIAMDNQGPQNPSISVNTVESFAFSRTIEVSLSANGDPAEVFIAGDVVNDDRTFQWIPFSAEEGAAMQTSLNLRGIDGEKTIAVVFRDGARSESQVAETVITLELDRPELAASCRITQTDVEPIRAYLALQFSEAIGRTDPRNLFVTLRDKASPQNVVHLDGVSTEPILSNDIVMLEISPEQLDEIRQWQPMTFAASYIQAEIAEDGVFDLADRGNLSNEQTPADVFFVSPALSVQVDLDPISFSPNGDEVRDEITISYLPARDSDVTIRIRDSQREVVREWLAEDQVGGLVHSVEWSGKKPDGTPYPDGEYTLIIMGSEVGVLGFAYGLKLNFSLDNSPPQIVDVRPREEEEISSLFRVSISVVDTPKTSGIEFAYITIGGDIENRILLAKSETEGEYVMPATSELLLPPGNVDVGFHVVDMAGNEAEQFRSYKVVAETEPEFSVMNFPNPFPPGGTTTIRYSLPERAIRAEIAIYDAGGDMVFFREMGQEELEIGEHSFQWDGRNMFAEILARGVYFCRLWVTTAEEDENKIHKIAVR